MFAAAACAGLGWGGLERARNAQGTPPFKYIFVFSPFLAGGVDPRRAHPIPTHRRGTTTGATSTSQRSPRGHEDTAAELRVGGGAIHAAKPGAHLHGRFAYRARAPAWEARGGLALIGDEDTCVCNAQEHETSHVTARRMM